MLSASPEPPLPKQEERRGGTEGGLKGEEKGQKRKEKNQRRQEESRLSSPEKREPQKSLSGGQGKRERQASESEQVSPLPRKITSSHPWVLEE